MSEASPASIFKRSAKTRARQRRERTPSDEGSPVSMEQESGSPVPSKPSLEDSPMSQVAKLKAKQRTRSKNKGTVNLSFGGEEEDGTEEFKVKKSALSNKLKLREPPPTPGSPISINLDQHRPTQSPRYNKAYLSELKASTPSSSFRVRASDATDADTSVEMNHDDSFADVSVGPYLSIPAESEVRAAREKRERLRAGDAAAGGSEDYISLTVSKSDASKASESRFVREEDEYGEGDEDMAQYTGSLERIAIGKAARKKEAGVRRAAIAEMIDIADEDIDEETIEWEAAQERRGAAVLDKDDLGRAEDAPVYKPRPIPTPIALPSLTTAMSRLSGTLSNLESSRTLHQNNLEAVEAEGTQLLQKDIDMRRMVEMAERKRAWFNDMKEWMENIAVFLDEKFPKLEELEKEHISLLTERYDMLVQRRIADDEDDLSLFLNIPPPPDGEKVDDMGRTIAYGPHAPQREARRAARQARFTHSTSRTPPKVSITSLEDLMGYSTDADLSTSSQEDYIAAREQLSAKVSSLLEDVKSEEFRDPVEGLAKRFNGWRTSFQDSYTGAWGGLGLVGAWEWWARLEIAGWDPLDDPRSLDTFHWYRGLYEYSRLPGTGDDEEHAEFLGPDGELANSMVTTAVIPRLSQNFSNGGFDPYSSRHMRRLVDLIEQIEVCVEKTDRKFIALLKSINNPFCEAINATHKLLGAALQAGGAIVGFDPQSISARRRFMVRQLKLLINLIAWRRLASDVPELEVDDIVKRLINEIMTPVANTGWEVGGEELLQKAKGVLPRDLIM